MHNATDVKPDVGLFSRYDALFRRKPSNRSRPPKIFVLGGPGPSVEIARRGIQKGYADGWATTWFPPCGASDWYAETINTLRAIAESADRNPDDLIFWCGMSCGTNADDSQREAVCATGAVRLHSALELPGSGPTYERWGFDRPHPWRKDYYYAWDFIPMNCTRAAATRRIEHFTPAMVARAKFVGTPSQTAEQIWP